MTITIITSEPLKDFPPAIALLQTLDRLGHHVVFLSPYRDPYFETMGLSNAVHHFAHSAAPEWMTSYHTDRIRASLAFRFEQLLRKRCLRKLPQLFMRELQSSDVVWILNENTTYLAGKGFVDRLGPFMQTMYELHIKNGKVPEFYHYAANKALLTVVPEYNRAHICKAYYSLPHMPAIIPNKPLDHPRQKNLPISDPTIAEKMAQIKDSGKKIVMYMGILSSERPLEPVIEAVEQMDGYVLAVLGGRTPYLDRLEKTMAGRFEYLGSVKPPHHLEIASHADVTYISYVANNGSINAVFCAPNKVYEFAGFGIPMLCNDNPGLKYTVEYNGMGICVPELTTTHIAAALKQIDADAEAMGEAANRYFDSESVEQAVVHTLERYMTIKREVVR